MAKKMNILKATFNIQLLILGIPTCSLLVVASNAQSVTSRSMFMNEVEVVIHIECMDSQIEIVHVQAVGLQLQRGTIV